MVGLGLAAIFGGGSNPLRTSEATPVGMVWIPGGEFFMGSSYFPDARPVHRVRVDGFWMDQTEVTNSQFARFVNATGYTTVAEQSPRAEDFPGSSREDLVPGAVIFTPPGRQAPLNRHYRWWRYVKGANWRHPTGPSSTINHKGNHPVVNVAWQDALAYANWSGKQLPTEAEWEFAARGGLHQQPYTWGNQFQPGGRFQANTYQGSFPNQATEEDGYSETSPAKSFPANGYGLYDMAGNAWEWVSDWYRHDYFDALARSGEIAINPLGPTNSFDPAEPDVPKRVMKGGSFLCTDQYCRGYMPGGRGRGDPDTGLNHLGFRLVLRRR